MISIEISLYFCSSSRFIFSFAILLEIKIRQQRIYENYYNNISCYQVMGEYCVCCENQELYPEYNSSYNT